MMVFGTQVPADRLTVREIPSLHTNVLKFFYAFFLKTFMRPLTSPNIRCLLNHIPKTRGGVIRRGYHASVLPSLVSTASPEFQARSMAMDELVRDLEEKMKRAREGGGLKAAERMRNKGKKLPRERFVGYIFLSQKSKVLKKPSLG